MKRTLLVLAAAGVVLVSNGWAVFSSLQNRRAPEGGRVELTERELRLPPLIGDSTALSLELNYWRGDPEDRRGDRFLDWLDAAKLAELGFDCSVPVTSPHARDHYSAARNALVYLVLQFDGETARRFLREGTDRSHRPAETRLFVVDAGKDPRSLRKKYPDPARFIITRGVVMLELQKRGGPDDRLLPQPRLAGWILRLAVNQVFVPTPESKLLQPLRHRPDATEEPREPRFAATVCWGTDYQPWIESVRLLPK
jgi:hypothetical protein